MMGTVITCILQMRKLRQERFDQLPRVTGRQQMAGAGFETGSSHSEVHATG